MPRIARKPPSVTHQHLHVDHGHIAALSLDLDANQQALRERLNKGYACMDQRHAQLARSQKLKDSWTPFTCRVTNGIA